MGRVRTRSGDRYKPSAIRSYEAALRDTIVPELGGKRLGDVQRRDVQRLADDLLAEGRDPSTIRNALMPLRVIYRRAIENGDAAVNPCANLRLPAVGDDVSGSPRPRRRSGSSRLCPTATVRCGRPPSTPVCVAAS